MKIWDRFKAGISRAPAKLEDNKFLRALLTSTMSSRTFGLMNPTDQASLVNAYKGWVYVFASKNATSVASQRLGLYTAKQPGQKKALFPTQPVEKSFKKYLMQKNPGTRRLKALNTAEEIEEVLVHPFLDLMKHVNPTMNRFDLWEGTQIFEELTGHSYWYVVRDIFGTPAQVWLLPAPKMTVVPGDPNDVDRRNLIDGYILSMGAYKEAFTAEEVVMFKSFSPISQFYGYAPLTAGADSYNTDLAMKKYNINTFKNAGRPDGVLILPPDSGIVGKEEIEELRREWNRIMGGVDNVEKTAILSGGIDYKQVSFSPKDLAFLAGKGVTVKELAAIFGIPVSKLDNDSNRANADSGEYQYMKDTIQPKCWRKEEKINEQFIPMYNDPNLFVVFDNPVPDDGEYALKERETNLKNYVVTINEERRKLGMEDVEWGDKPLVGSGIAPLGENMPQSVNPREARELVDAVKAIIKEK